MQLSRRAVLGGSVAVSALLGTKAAATAESPARRTGVDPALGALLSRQLHERLLHDPQSLTSLGLDTGSLAWARSRLTQTGPEAEAAARQRLAQHHAELAAFDTARLSEADRRLYDASWFKLDSLHRLSRRFPFGTTRGPYFTPYIVTQLTGAWYEVPALLDEAHPVETRADAEAYLARLSAFADILDGETARIAQDAERGIVPPDFMLARTASGIEAMAKTPAEESGLVRSLGERAARQGLGGFEKRAARIFDRAVSPALLRQAGQLRSLLEGARHDAGCYALPQGEEIYRLGLLDNTTRPLSGAQVHALGLAEVAAIHQELEPLLADLGLTEGGIGARIAAMTEDRAHAFPDTDAGRASLLAYVRTLVADISDRLPEAFHRTPGTPLVVQPVPQEIAAGAPGGYYTPAPLEGSRPATYSINLEHIASWPRWALPPLTHHEAMPGHHLQIGTLREGGDIPLYQRLLGFTAYSEGWALYAEKLARELGAYGDDKAGLVGQLQSQLFRAVRLVVDSGIHHERWSREQAIRYMIENAGKTEATAVREIERYAVWPGNACAYKVGEITMSKLRRDAEEALGDAFDLRDFHDVILSSGPVPLPVLERAVTAHVAAERG